MIYIYRHIFIYRCNIYKNNIYTIYIYTYIYIYIYTYIYTYILQYIYIHIQYIYIHIHAHVHICKQQHFWIPNAVVYSPSSVWTFPGSIAFERHTRDHLPSMACHGCSARGSETSTGRSSLAGWGGGWGLGWMGWVRTGDQRWEDWSNTQYEPGSQRSKRTLIFLGKLSKGWKESLRHSYPNCARESGPHFPLVGEAFLFLGSILHSPEEPRERLLSLWPPEFRSKPLILNL
jgi:hypothetical protein